VDRKQAIIASIVLAGVAALGLGLKYGRRFLLELNQYQPEEAIA